MMGEFRGGVWSQLLSLLPCHGGLVVLRVLESSDHKFPVSSETILTDEFPRLLSLTAIVRSTAIFGSFLATTLSDAQRANQIVIVIIDGRYRDRRLPFKEDLYSTSPTSA